MHSWPHPQVSDCFRQSGPILQTGGHGHRARRGFRARRVPVNRSASSRTGPQRIHVQQFLIIFIRQDRIQAGFNVKSILYCEQTKVNAKYATQLTQGLIEINIIHMDARWRHGSIRTSLSIKDAYRSSNGTARPSINFSHEFTARRSHIAKGNLKIFAHRMLTQKTDQEVTDPYHRLYTVTAAVVRCDHAGPRRRRSSVGGPGERVAGGVAASTTSAAGGPGPAGVAG